MFKRLDHVGIVVNNLDEALRTYCDQLGFTLLQRVAIPEQRVEAAFLEAHNSTIELITPTDSESGTARFLQNRGEGMHHVCYEVEDLAAALAELKRSGRPSDRRDAAPGYPRSGGLCPPQGDARYDDRTITKGEFSLAPPAPTSSRKLPNRSRPHV